MNLRTEKKPEKINPIGSGKPDISIVDAAIVGLGKEITDIKKELETQRTETKNIIIGVLIAFVAIVVTVAIAVLISNLKDGRRITDFYEKHSSLVEEINQQKLDLNDLGNRIDNLKVRNPYLK